MTDFITRRLRRSGTLVAVALAALVALPAAAGANSHPGRYIVVLEASADAGAVARDHARRHAADVSFVYKRALNGYAATIPAQRLAAVRSDARVAFVAPDREVRALGKPVKSQPAQITPTGVTRIATATLTTPFDTAPGVAVIDTGSGPHSDLNVVGGVNCSTGRPDKYADGNGHGTHVAGTIGAKNDDFGVVGVAPQARIFSVRVLDNAGSGTWSSVACGIDWVTANAAAKNITVANMSLGGGTSATEGTCENTNGDALHTAICNSVAAGVTYVVAAGNEATDLASSVPARYDTVLTVTAMADFNGEAGGGAEPTCREDVDDTSASFSNYYVTDADGAHTIAAPGVCIRSTWKDGGYNTISGTSMASPHVAGAALRCIVKGVCDTSGDGATTPTEVMGKLREDAAAAALTGHGFSADGGRLFGDLLHAGGY